MPWNPFYHICLFCCWEAKAVVWKLANQFCLYSMIGGLRGCNHIRIAILCAIYYHIQGLSTCSWISFTYVALIMAGECNSQPAPYCSFALPNSPLLVPLLPPPLPLLNLLYLPTAALDSTVHRWLSSPFLCKTNSIPFGSCCSHCCLWFCVPWLWT